MDEELLAIEGFWVAVIAGIAIAGLWYLSGRNAEGEIRFRIALDYCNIFMRVLYVTFIDRGEEVENIEESEVEVGAAPDMSSPVVGDVSNSVDGVVTTDNSTVDGQLNPVNSTYIDINLVSLDEAREIIRYHAMVDALNNLIKSGVITNRAKAIESVFQCTRSSRPDSIYFKVRDSLNKSANDASVDEDDEVPVCL